MRLDRIVEQGNAWTVANVCSSPEGALRVYRSTAVGVCPASGGGEMSHSSRKTAKYAKQAAQAQRQQAAAARQMAWQNGQVAAAQSNLYQTQAQVLAGEAESRRVAALPRVCAHCRTPNPPGSRECAHCGSGTFLPPAQMGFIAPPPQRQRQPSAWTRFRKKSMATQVLAWIAASVVALVVLAAVAGTTTKPSGTAAPSPHAPVVLTLSGSAAITTPNFTVANPWIITYTTTVAVPVRPMAVSR